MHETQKFGVFQGSQKTVKKRFASTYTETSLRVLDYIL